MAKSTMNRPEIETLSYKPKTRAENKESVVECHNTMTSRECINCVIDAAGKCHLSKPEQPNKQLMLIQTIQNLATCILNSISKLPKSTLKDQAYDDMNIFETGILFKLQKEYE